MNYTIREIKTSESPLLDDFLYEAIYVPKGAAPPPRSILTAPELQVYTRRFGESDDDKCLVAEVGGTIVGAVWTRIMDDYGHIDDHTPSLAISLYKEYRGNGIGAAMMKALLDLLKKSGYKRVSLSVQKENFTVNLYRKVGFEIAADHGEEYIMACDLKALPESEQPCHCKVLASYST